MPFAPAKSQPTRCSQVTGAPSPARRNGSRASSHAAPSSSSTPCANDSPPRALTASARSWSSLTTMSPLAEVRACHVCASMTHAHVLGNANGSIDAQVLFVAEAVGRRGGAVTGVPLTRDESGRRFTLFPPEQVANLYVGPIEFNISGPPISMVSLRNPDLARFPRFAEALAASQSAELAPGDAIYIPYGWWHHVEALEPFNVLVNYWWNEARQVGSPFDSMLHAILTLRDLPPEQRAVWRTLFEHYVFTSGDESMSHLPREQRGMLGPPSPERAQAIRAILASRSASTRSLFRSPPSIAIRARSPDPNRLRSATSEVGILPSSTTPPASSNATR